jgi:hypothetical protein
LIGEIHHTLTGARVSSIALNSDRIAICGIKRGVSYNKGGYGKWREERICGISVGIKRSYGLEHQGFLVRFRAYFSLLMGVSDKLWGPTSLLSKKGITDTCAWD